jgi:hypothetical protein
MGFVKATSPYHLGTKGVLTRWVKGLEEASPNLIPLNVTNRNVHRHMSQ